MVGQIIRGWSAVFAVLLQVGLAPWLSSAQAATTLTIIVFPTADNWPLWAADEKGFFAHNGVAVHVTPTPSSTYQMSGLIAGKFDIAGTAIDNLIAYDEGQGEAPIQGTPDLFAFMGGNNGFLHLVADPAIETIRDFKGKELAVDATTTGYAFLLRKLLARGGLQPSDYTLVKVGGSVQRYEALLQHRQVGTMLSMPYPSLAQAQGFKDMATVTAAFGHYQAYGGIARRSWAKTHRAALVGYIRAYVAALDWLFERSNKAEALALLTRNMKNVSPELARTLYDMMLDPATGIDRKARLDIAGIKTVLALRSEYGEPQKKLGVPARYYDLSYYRQALGR